MNAKIAFGTLTVTLLLVIGTAFAAKTECATIQGGTIFTGDGNLITTGYDSWGYNYQAHIFNGLLENSPRPDEIATSGTHLIMKWNDAYLSKMDCDGNGRLDRPHGYRGSGAWLTNHQRGNYELEGKTCSWEYFVKIAAVPADAELIDGIWYTADGTKIGYDFGRGLAKTQEVYNDPCGDALEAQIVTPKP